MGHHIHYHITSPELVEHASPLGPAVLVKVKVFGDATLYVSCGGPLTRSGSLLSIEGMSLDAVVDSAVSTQHYAGIK